MKFVSEPYVKQYRNETIKVGNKLKTTKVVANPITIDKPYLHDDRFTFSRDVRRGTRSTNRNKVVKLVFLGTKLVQHVQVFNEIHDKTIYERETSFTASKEAHDRYLKLLQESPGSIIEIPVVGEGKALTETLKVYYKQFHDKKSVNYAKR